MRERQQDHKEEVNQRIGTAKGADVEPLLVQMHNRRELNGQNQFTKIIERGLEAKQFLENPIYQKYLIL